MHHSKIREGQWYQHPVSRESFCVISVDELLGVIDVRDENGDVDEFGFEEWADMNLEESPPPVGWVELESEEELEYEPDYASGERSPGHAPDYSEQIPLAAHPYRHH